MVKITQPLATTRRTLVYLKSEMKKLHSKYNGIHNFLGTCGRRLRMSGSDTFHLLHNRRGRTLNKERFQFVSKRFSAALIQRWYVTRKSHFDSRFRHKMY